MTTPDATNAISTDLLRQEILDQEHLRLLSIAYLVSAAVSAFSSLFGLMYAAMGLLFGAAIAQSSEPAPPEFIGWLFGAFGLGLFLVMMTLAVLKAMVWDCLRKRRSRTFCMVIAGVSALGIPYGTLLCVFTFLVLTRPSVKPLFQDYGN
jgi:hypothetical protein